MESKRNERKHHLNISNIETKEKHHLNISNILSFQMFQINFSISGIGFQEEEEKRISLHSDKIIILEFKTPSRKWKENKFTANNESNFSLLKNVDKEPIMHLLPISLLKTAYWCQSVVISIFFLKNVIFSFRIKKVWKLTISILVPFLYVVTLSRQTKT